MAISIFPSTAAEFVSNNFVIDMNDSTNNTADTGGIKQAGPYSMSFSSGDTSFDVYFVDEEGNSVGYSNTTSIVATGLFSTVVIFGVAQDEVISFQYQGSVNNADGEGNEPGAGAYLESISPSDLPSIDDTATVTGGNFGADTEITFESGATVLPAKSITVVSGTELLVTRPDGLIEDDAPYDLKAVNPGVPTPTTKDFVLTDAVTAGSDPTWVTTSPLNTATKDVAFSQTLEATDSDGTVVDYSVTAGTLLTGLSLDSSTGVLSGTPTAFESTTFTVTATDDGGNQTSREFEHSAPIATGGTITVDGGFTYHTFTATDDFEAFGEITNAEYLVVAAGGGGNQGGGGAGGLLNGTATISAGTTTVTVGAGAGFANGGDSSFGSIAIATGGGTAGDSGGSGGGGSPDGAGGSGTAGQGNDGGDGSSTRGGGGGGAGEPGFDGTSDGGNGGDGLQFLDFATATNTGVDNGYYAGGGGGSNGGVSGLGSKSVDFATVDGTGAGGLGGNQLGGDGIVIVRYSI